MSVKAGHWDAVVVGGGFAGMVAAVRAAELGLRVIVLEKGVEAAYPCNSRYSGGIIHIAYRDPANPPEQLMSSIERETAGVFERRLGEALSRNGARLIEWLRGQGVRFMSFSSLETHRWCMAPPRAVVPGMDWQGRGPDVALRQLESRLVELEGSLSRGSIAHTLVMKDGVCTGVEGISKGKSTLWSAAAVVLADGGFQANPNLFQGEIGGSFADVLQRGAATGEGSAYMMAETAGAGRSGAGKFYGHVLCHDALANDRLWPYPQLDELLVAGVVIDESGRRFLDEGLGGINAANVIGARVGGPVFGLFDEAIWDGPGKAARIPANPLIEQVGAQVFRGDTIDSLAGQLEIDPVILARTVEEHNAICNNSVHLCAVPRTTTKFPPSPLVSPPFMAIRLVAGITYTMSGIATDGSGQVLRVDGSAILGLFAAGSCTGGLEGGGATGYVGGLSKAGVFGLLCAERIAELQGKAASRNVSKIGGSESMITDPLRSYPALSMVVQHGRICISAAALVVAILILVLLWPSGAILAVAAAAIGGIGLAVVGLVITELVRLVTDILLPK